MALSFRFIFWLPVIIFFLLNLTFKLVIFLLQHIGNAIVWCNRQCVKGGDWATRKAENDDSIDKFLEKLQQSTTRTKALVNAKRGKK